MKLIIKCLIVILLFVLTGCESHKDINDLGIVSALGIEKKEDIFIVTAQVINVKKSTQQGGNNSSSIITFTENGNTIFEAVRKITTKSSKKLYYAHMKLLIIDSSILNDDPYEITDFLAKDSESMINFYVLVTMENKPQEILETLTPLEEIPAEFIIKSLTSSEANSGYTYSMTFEQYIDDLVTNGVDPIYTKISLTNKNEKHNNTEDLQSTKEGNLKLGNILVFDENRKLVELSDKESSSLNILINKTKNGIITVKCDNAFYTAEIMKNNTSPTFDEKEKKVTYTSKITISISDYPCNEDLSKNEVQNKIKKQVKEYLEKNNNLLLAKSLKYNSDFLGVGKAIKAKHKNFFDFKNKDWSKEGFPTILLESKVQIEIEKRGNLEGIIEKRFYK